ncbi:hypothetical protein D3C75_636920 [compost metagenome]
MTFRTVIFYDAIFSEKLACYFFNLIGLTIDNYAAACYLFQNNKIYELKAFKTAFTEGKALVLSMNFTYLI